MVSALGIVFVVLLVFVLLIMAFFVFRHFLREHCCKRQIERRLDRQSNNAQDNGIGRHQRQTNSNAHVNNRNRVISSTEDPAPPYVPRRLSQLRDTSRIQQGPESPPPHYHVALQISDGFSYDISQDQVISHL